MNIAICDDEKLCIDRMIECLDKASKELGTQFVYKRFSSGEELLKYDENIDILFLDVEMDGINGIETMKFLETKENVKFIIFASSHSEYVFDSFGEKTMGFLCKPVDDERVLKKIKKVIEKLNAKKNIKPIEINVDGRNVLISPEDIVYISGEKNYVRVVTKNEQYLTYGNMKAWEENIQWAMLRVQVIVRCRLSKKQLKVKHHYIVISVVKTSVQYKLKLRDNLSKKVVPFLMTKNVSCDRIKEKVRR